WSMKWVVRHDKETDAPPDSNADDYDRILSCGTYRDAFAYAAHINQGRNCYTAGERSVHGGVRFLRDGACHCGYISVLVCFRAVCDPAADPDRRTRIYDNRRLFRDCPEAEDRTLGAGNTSGECELHADRRGCPPCEKDYYGN